ncbi:MAG: TonB-dependent receptor [Roseivirga sp.]|nr:TonB-dependent receptor [Roseivirga sp.]
MLRKGYLILLLLCLALPALAQYRITGKVLGAETGEPIELAQVYNKTTKALVYTNAEGDFEMTDLEEGSYDLLVFSYEYEVWEQTVKLETDFNLKIKLEVLGGELTEVVISQRREEIFGISRLKPVEGTSIFAGKKTEVILLDQSVGNLAANNARQVYAQVVGLNIYDNVDAGLQLNVGGRGLDPNRTANFNTRQNGYDISADVLGYPESYYTPPAEALSEIQVIRGAASLQYGTQFGGLINFKMKQPNPTQKLELVSRQSVGSFNLYTSFNSLSGTSGKFSYYTYFNYKRGDGYRANSEFDSKNFFGSVNYAFNAKTKLQLEFSYLNYLAQQAGGLSDSQFRTNPDFSNRARNWFQVKWALAALKFTHKFSSKTDFSLNVFGLDAERNAVGFRGNPILLNSNPVTQIDEQEVDGTFVNPRDLIKGEFNNWGAEARILTRYNIGNKSAAFLLGSKYYHANNTSRQGPGSLGTDADFSFAADRFPDYSSQSDFRFPNRNLAFFGENIFFLSDKLSLTPGFRFEHIRTESSGNYRQVNFDNAGNPIFNQQLEDNRSLIRSFLLAGLGASYDHSDNLEAYANFSLNYRSVTFSDIRVVSPTFIIDPDISDEEGFTTDLGFRGKWNDQISYDIGGFGLLYDDRIGIILDDRANRVRKNIGKAFIYGLEAFFDWNLISTFKADNSQFKLNWFVNGALTSSEYIDSEENNVKGKKVEFIPTVNLKTGINAGYRNLLASIQFTYLSEQFTDVENSSVPADGDIRNGVIGEIPAYGIIDFSLSYSYKKWRIETGINNLLDNAYFTRRATGYPGPGIIPSDPRTFYLTLGVKF